MQLALEVLIKLCGFIVPKKVKLKNEIERLDEIIKNETDEKLKQRHLSKRKELSFEYHFEFRAKAEHIDLLLAVCELSPKIQTFQMRDAYWIWKIENRRIHTDIGKTKAAVGRFLFNLGSGGFGMSIIFGVLMISLTDAALKESFLYAAVSCFSLSSMMVFLSIPFKQADIIQKYIIEAIENQSSLTSAE